MQQQLNLTRELVQNLMRVLNEHDAQAKDALIAAQYLAAVIGLLVGNTRQSSDEREELLQEILAFGRHVYQDVVGQQEAQPSPPPADPAKAFGIWKPPGK